MSSKLPLPRNFFDVAPLQDDEVTSLKTQATNLAINVIRTARVQGGSQKWELQSDDSDLKIYKGANSASTDNLQCAVLEVAGTIDEAIELFRTDSADLAAEFHARFQSDVLDRIVLYSLMEPSSSSWESGGHDKMDVSWMALKSPMKTLSNPRDQCVLSCCHEYDYEHKRGWVYAFQSVDVPGCPLLKTSHGLARTYHVGSGYVFQESDRPGYIQISYLSHTRPMAGPEWATTDVSAPKRCRNLVDMDRFLRENRLSATPFLGKGDVVPVALRRICFLCRKKFGSFGRKTNCFKCGEVMCTSCNHHWHARVNGVPAKVRVCTKCSSGSAAASYNPSHGGGLTGLTGLQDRTSRQSTMSVDTDFSMFRNSFESDATFDVTRINLNDSPSNGHPRHGSNPRMLYQEQWDQQELRRRAMLLHQTQPDPEPATNQRSIQL